MLRHELSRIFFSLPFSERLRLKCFRVRLTNPDELKVVGPPSSKIIARQFSTYHFDGSLLGGADV